MNLTAEEFGGAVRSLAAFGFGVMAGNGWIGGATATVLAGAVGVLATAGWSVWAKRANARKRRSAAAARAAAK